MFEIVKKALFTGVGLASMTKEKLEELAKDVSRHADLSESQAAEFQADLERRAETARDDLKKQIDQQAEQVIDRLKLARSEDLASLSAKVAALSARVEALEAKGDEPPPTVSKP